MRQTMSRIERKNAITLGEALMMMLKSSRLGAEHNTQRIFEAWDNASGAGRYTVRRFYRDGKLYITLNSSVVRSQLGFQKDALIEKMNVLLAGDDLFIRDNGNAAIVKELILK